MKKRAFILTVIGLAVCAGLAIFYLSLPSGGLERFPVEASDSTGLFSPQENDLVTSVSMVEPSAVLPESDLAADVPGNTGSGKTETTSSSGNGQKEPVTDSSTSQPPAGSAAQVAPQDDGQAAAKEGKWEDGKYLLPDGTYATGLVTIGGKLYAFDSRTYEMLTGRQSIGGNYYHFDLASGVALSGWMNDPDDASITYYYSKEGPALTGLQLFSGGNRYYFHPATGARQSGLQTVGGKVYYFAGKNDSALKGWQDVSAASSGSVAAAAASGETKATNRYYFSSEHYALTGVQALSDKVYAFNSQGIQLTGWQFIDPNLYLFSGTDGAAKTSGWAEHPQGDVYLGADGAAYKGLRQVDGNTYYFGFVTANGWVTVNGDTYYFAGERNAALKNQWARKTDDTRDTYYLGADGIAYKGIKTVEDNRYGFGEDGRILLGQQTVGGKVYFFDQNTGILQTGWQPAGEKTYYVGATEGYALTGVQKIDGYLYYFRPSDAMRGTGLVEHNGKTYYFDDTTGHAVTGEYVYNGAHYYFGEDGVALTGIQKIGGDSYFYNTSGVRKTGWQKVGGHYYYFDPESAKAKTSTWFTDIVQGGMYYFNANGQALTGAQTIGGESYTFDETGKLVSGAVGNWVEDGASVYYVYPDGANATGLATIDNALYYFDGDGVRQQGWVTTGGRKYYFDPENGCKAKAGWMTLDDKTYYFGAVGAACTSMCEIETALYAFDTEGVMQTGLVSQNGARYYFGAGDGKAVSGWYPSSGDAEARYYDPDTKAALTGMQWVGENLYLFDDTGLRVGGWHVDGNGLRYYFKTTGDMSAVIGNYQSEQGNYYFAPEGYAYVGLVYIEDVKAWYYFDGEGLRQDNGWQTVAGRRYHFGADGKADTGKKVIDGETYYFHLEYAFALAGEMVEIDGLKYEFDPDGKMMNEASTPGGYSWKTIDGVPHYVDGDGNGLEPAGLNEVDGYWYWFSDKGAVQTGWQTRTVEAEGGSVTLRHLFGADGRAVTGWHREGEDTYYLGADGEARTGEQMIDEKPYTFDSEGRLVTGEVPDYNQWNEDGTVYYDETGKPAVGLRKIDGFWYCFSEEGVLFTDRWVSLDDSRYYFGVDGKGYTGWQQVEEAGEGAVLARWYRFDEDSAKQLAGWQYRLEGGVNRTHYFADDGSAPLGNIMLNGVDRYFFPDGHMAIGWEEIDGGEYYFYSNGAMATGVVSIEGELCSFDGSGKRITGWNTDSQGRRYHFTGEVPASGWTLVENRWYRFDENTYRQLTGWQYRTDDSTGERYTFYYYSGGNLPDEGPQKVGGVERYFFADGHMAVGFEVIGEYLYHFATNGEMTTGTKVIGGVSYPFAADGKLAMGWVSSGASRYYIGKDGAEKGWAQVDGVWYCFDDDNAVQKTGWQTRTGDDGKTTRHYYGSGGVASVGWTGAGMQRRYFHADGSAAAGWLKLDGKDYYFLADGQMATGVVQIDGATYSFDGEGQLLEGWNTDSRGNRYYFTGDGALTGWAQAEDRWYHFDEKTGVQQLGWQERTVDGVVLHYYYFENGSLPAAGWNTAIDGQRRYVMEDGQLARGFTSVDGKPMCFAEKGTILAGWQKIDGRWYVMDSDGVQLTGWQTRPVNSSYNALYYYYSDGTLPPAGWCSDIESERRYVMEDGELARGWLTLDSFKYYFQERGIPLVGRHTIDGTEYYFDEQGRYVAPPVISKVAVESGSAANKSVTVTATVNSLLKDKTLLYSFDSGATWSTAKSAKFKAGSTIAANTIRVKDSAGSVTKYKVKITIPKSTSHGVDVAVYQGKIDWGQVASSGKVDFAIIRSLHWNGDTTNPKTGKKGYYDIDPYFDYNVRQAKKYGIKVGTYLYSYAFKDSEMKEEIEVFMSSPEIKQLLKEKIYFDLPVFIDYEDPLIATNTANQTIAQRTQTVRYGMVLIEQLSAGKYRSGFYVNKSWGTNMINATQLQAEGYDFWLARWNNTGHGWSPAPALWQYSNGSGLANIPGINTRVDRNYMYKSYEGDINGGNTGSEGSSGGSTTRKITVTNQSTGKKVTSDAADILAQIVMAEVGGFGNAEVFKAQAIAAQAWIINQNSQGYVAPTVALKTPTSAVTSAVNAVADKTLTYNGQPALTPYYAWSNGKTNPATYWNDSNNLPYLKSVDSSYDKSLKKYSQTYSISEAKLKDKLKSVYGYDVTSGYSPSNWIKITSWNSAGYATGRLNVCGRTPKVDYFITTMFPGIGSPDFDVKYSSGTFTFTYRGYGHCVGMSQYGAYGLALEGKTYKQILSHFYPGTTISSV